MNQCYQLGEFFKNRYLNSYSENYIANISLSRQSIEYKFIASYYHRTAISQWV
jgi:hypothetical protein